jgi:hypothetical protein
MMSMHDTLAERYRAHPKIVLPTKIYTVVVTLSYSRYLRPKKSILYALIATFTRVSHDVGRS